MSQRTSWCRALSCVLLCLASAAAGAAEARTKEKRIQVALTSRAGMSVRRALLSARLRLADERCRSVLSDFSAGGRPLAAVLEDLGRTPQSHLDSLTFKDGSGRARCASQSIMAFTHVGSQTVFVCAAQFSRMAEEDPVSADVMLIHEALHTLGLGENPPSSGEITARVAARCGR